MNLEANLSRSRAQDASTGLDLAHQAPFSIGTILVEPALRLLSAGEGKRTVIQPLAMRVLVALVEAGGQTRSREDLIEACWNQRIVSDDAVHRIISTLRHDLALLSPSTVAIETIPKVGYRLRVDADTRADDRSSEAAPSGLGGPVSRWPVALALIAALVSIGLFAATRANLGIAAIAVVAEDTIADAETVRFADDLTGDLARLASAMPSIAFVEATGQNAVEPLLLRVALDAKAGLPTARVRLVDGNSDTVVWSREFTAEGGTMAELRELVANGVTGLVQCGLDRSAEFDDPVGLRLFLGACEGLETGDMERARTFAQQITRFRPDVPAGWACLANTTIFAEAQNGPVASAVVARAETYARRALAADPKSGLAYVALAMASRWRGEPVLQILEEGIRADPDFAMLHKHYALALTDAGMVAAAVDPALRAVALHPHDPGLYRLAVTALVNAGRTAEALTLSDKMQRLWRYDEGVEMQRLDMLFYAPNAKAALSAFAASPLRDSPKAGRIREALVWRADPAGYDWSRFDRLAREMQAHDADLAWRVSATAARMGDRGRALDWLSRAPHDTYNGWSQLFAPEALAVRRDPQFFAKMASVGMVRRWQRSGRWPDFCSDPALAYDCRGSVAALTPRSVDDRASGPRGKDRT